MKSSLIPLVIGIGSGVLYGFAKTWIDTVFALCV
jgi:ABC-type dipeptide/oligopeptide/nickel transport system permease subunit